MSWAAGGKKLAGSQPEIRAGAVLASCCGTESGPTGPAMSYRYNELKPVLEKY